MRPAVAPTWPYRPCLTGPARRPSQASGTTMLVHFALFLSRNRAGYARWFLALYVTNHINTEDKAKNLKGRMFGKFVNECRPGALGGPGTYCNDAPLTNAGTPKRFASISYPLETRWPATLW